MFFLISLSFCVPIFLFGGICDTTKAKGFFIIKENSISHFCVLKKIDSTFLRLSDNIDSSNIKEIVSPISFESGLDEIVNNSWIVRNEYIPDDFADRVKYVRICFAEVAFFTSKIYGKVEWKKVTSQHFILYGTPFVVRSDRVLVEVTKVNVYPK